MIRFLKHNEIEKPLWDECVRQAPNGLPFALSWYLDLICPGWHALVLDDYQTVMPLPHRTKYGVPYIYPPHNAQQLGVFGSNLNEEIIHDFLKAIPKKYLVVEMRMNEQNPMPKNRYKVQWRNNHLLDISGSYDDIVKGYNRNGKRNLKKSIEAGLTPVDQVGPAIFSEFLIENLQDQIEKLSDNEISLIRSIAEETLKRNAGELVGVAEPDGTLAAVGFYLFFRKRLLFSVCASTPAGKQKQAMYRLVDHQLQKHAGRFETYDFTGSEIKGIAYFNSTFGAKPVKYPQLHFSRFRFW